MTKKNFMTNAFIPGAAKLNEREQSLIARRDKLLGPAYNLFYDQPIEFVRGEGVWLFDREDNAYLDTYNNVPSVGHCHPYVVDAICKQAATLNTNTRYMHDNILDYAEVLLSKFPDDLSHVMFTCTGSEANDLAYRICTEHTGGTGFIVTELAYHGCTHAIAGLSPSLGPAVNLGIHTRTIPAPDSYRDNADAGQTFITNLKKAINDMQRHGIKPAALLVDTIFASDGVFESHAGFLKEAADIIRSAGGLFIADEVQPGFGRTGEAWFGFQRHDVVPDMVSIGKGMGGGHPIAGLVVKPALVQNLGKSRYFNTFGGNTVSTAAAKAVIDVIENENLIKNAKVVGAYLKRGLNQLADKHIIIGDVRGLGFFLGVELVNDRDSKEPATEQCAQVVNRLRQKRILISSAGPFVNILKIRPPMCFNQDNADLFLKTFDEVLSELSIND